MATPLQLVLLLLASAVLVIALFRALNLPPILGYLLVGAVIGPHAGKLLPESAGTRHLAEFGVVFLMFTIGLEFSLPRLMSMKRIVFGLGLAQVLVTSAAILLCAWLLGLSWQGALALGGALASRRPRWPASFWSSAWNWIPRTAARSWACCCSRILPWCHC